MRIGGRALPLAVGLLGALSGQSTSGSILEGSAPDGMLAEETVTEKTGTVYVDEVALEPGA